MAAVDLRTKFDIANERAYENGVDHCVLYTGDGWKGVVWNGMTSIDVAPEGGESEALWADNIKYAVMRGAVSFAGSISCYQFPEEFNGCLGNVCVDSTLGIYAHEQTAENFRLVYRNMLHNAEKGHIGYRYHVLYNLTCDPSDMTFETNNDSPEAVEFSFDVEGSPVSWTKDGKTYTCCEFTFDVMNGEETTHSKILDKLYGTSSVEASCPDPEKLFVTDTISYVGGDAT